jgi:anti-sigma regulatory factor (Ser/Thr protein kinase)
VSSQQVDAGTTLQAPDESWAGEYALPHSRRSPSLARVLVAQALVSCPPELVETAQLLVSELVTNAVKHADSILVLRIASIESRWRVTVEDLSADAPEQHEAGGEVEVGRGLGLVDALATTWGWSRTTTGKQVWFELEISPDEGGRAGL